MKLIWPRCWPPIWHVQNDIKQLWTDIFFDRVSSKYPDMLSDISPDIWQSPNIWTDKTTKHDIPPGKCILTSSLTSYVAYSRHSSSQIMGQNFWHRRTSDTLNNIQSSIKHDIHDMTCDTAFQRTCPRHLDTRDVTFSILLVAKILNGIWDTSHLTSALASQEEQKIIYHPPVLINLPSCFVGTRHYFEYLGCLKKATCQPITKAPFCRMNHLKHHHRDLIPSQVGLLERLSGLQE